MTRVAYTGHERLTFSDYTNLETGQTLAAEPGESYDIAPASGRVVDDIPEAWFVPAGEGEEPPGFSAFTPDDDDEPPAGEHPDGDPADEEPQQS